MADEKASITVSLVDDASAGLEKLASGFDEVRKKAQDFHQQNQEQSQRTQRGLRDTGDGLESLEEKYRTLGMSIRKHFDDATKHMGEFGVALRSAETGIGAIARGAASAGSAIGLLGVSITGVVVGVGFAVREIYKMSESITRVSQDAVNLRMRLGEVNDTFIRSGEVIGTQLNQSLEQTHARMERFANQLHTLVRGSASEFYRGLAEFGPAGERIVEQARRGLERGMSPEEIRQRVIIPWVGRQDEATARAITDRMGWQYSIYKQEAEKLQRQRDGIERKVWTPSPERQREMDEAEFRIRTHFNNISIMFENAVNRIWEPFSLKVKQILADLLGWVDKTLGSIGDAWDAFWKKLRGRSEEPVTIPNLMPPNRPGYNQVPPDWQPPPRTVTPQEREEWYRRRGRRGSGPDAATPQRFMGDDGAEEPQFQFHPDLGWAGQMHGGYSTNIEDRRQLAGAVAERRDEIRMTGEQTGYQREIRDVMVWLRAQIEGKPAPAGGGAGGDLASQLGAGNIGASGGGGGAGGGGGFDAGGGAGFGGLSAGGGGARTGSPWFGGGAGRGTGGVPGMTGTQTASGAAFYQKALAAFQGSGLIGKVPPGGARFGITTGSAEEWARFATGVAKAESNFNPRSANTSDPGGSFGVLQYAHNQVPGGNAYDTDASIAAFVRDAAHGVGPGSLLARRFSTIGSHPERTIRNLANYGGAQQGDGGFAGGGGQFGGAGASGGDGAGVSGPVGPTGGSAPGYVHGLVSVGGQQFHWGSGGGGAGSIPSGTFPIHFGDIGNVGRRIGSIAGVGGAGGTIWDARLGRNRAGIQIHPNTHGSDLDRLYTAGCFSVPQNEWPRFREALLAQARNHPGGLFLNVNRNGQAIIGPRGEGGQRAPSPTLSGAVGAEPHGRVAAGGAGGAGGGTPSFWHGGAGVSGDQPGGVGAGGFGGGGGGYYPFLGGGGGGAIGGGDGLPIIQRGMMQGPSGRPQPVMIVSYDPSAARNIAEAHATAVQQMQQRAQTEQRSQLDADEERLTTKLQRLERGPTRETPRTRGAGGEAAPLGGAPEPHERAAGEGRLGVRTGRGARVEGAGGPRTRGAGGEAAPLGAAPPPASTRHQRLIDQTRRQLDAIRERRDEIERESKKRDESPQERLERLQREASARRDPESEIERQLRANRERSGEDKELDRPPPMEVKGKLGVDIDVRGHARVKAKGDENFHDVKISQTPQMGTTGDADRSSYAEE